MAGLHVAPSEQATQLPVRQHHSAVLQTVRSGAVSIIVGETGSGKTTQLPQMLLDSPGLLPDGAVVAVTQPRRVAAVAVARRVAEERGCRVGAEVGYSVRFDDCHSGRTRLKYLTDGTLLREMLTDPQLARYSAVVLDEAHERSLNTDILFALLKRLIDTRAERGPPLKVVVMSATMDAERLAAFFGGCAVLRVSGRQFPVELVYAAEEHSRDYVAAAVSVAVDVHQTMAQGDILVFLSGQAEVEKAARLITQEVAQLPEESCGGLLVLPLYAALPLEMQARVFVPPPAGCRRCVVATNIAETSITIDGVVYVIDAGMCKEKSFDPATGMERLAVQAISRVQATQRAGRAGRTAAGKCYRLYTQRYFERDMPDTTAPEIQRVPLLGAVLQLKALPAALGIDVLAFDFVDAPDRGTLEDALRHLHLLDAIDSSAISTPTDCDLVDLVGSACGGLRLCCNHCACTTGSQAICLSGGRITDTGQQIVALPLEPMLGRAILASLELRCAPFMLTIAAMLSVETLFLAEAPAAQRTPDDEVRLQQKQALLAEMQADGFGDHIFLLRLAEMTASPHLERDLVHALRMNGRGLTFARKVRSQLAAVVQQRVWPAYAERCRSGMYIGSKRERHEPNEPATAHRSDDEVQVASTLKQSDSSNMQAEQLRTRIAQSPACPPLDARNTIAKRQDVDRVRQALAIGYAPQIAKRMPAHNGSIPKEAAKMHIEDGLLPEWVVYHELAETGRVMLRKVCAVERVWLDPALMRLQSMDAQQLAKSGAESSACPQPTSDAGTPSGKVARSTATEQHTISAAKARALARRAAHAAGKKQK